MKDHHPSHDEHAKKPAGHEHADPAAGHPLSMMGNVATHLGPGGLQRKLARRKEAGGGAAPSTDQHGQGGAEHGPGGAEHGPMAHAADVGGSVPDLSSVAQLSRHLATSYVRGPGNSTLQIDLSARLFGNAHTHGGAAVSGQVVTENGKPGGSVSYELPVTVPLKVIVPTLAGAGAGAVLLTIAKGILEGVAAELIG